MQAGNELLHLIDKIIDISKIESAQVEIEEVLFEFDDLPLKMASLFENEAQQKGLRFACHVASDVPVKLIGDPTHLEQILTHFISNAIKFTEQGEVVLDVSLVNNTKKEGNYRRINEEMLNIEECNLLFSVTDTGVGIPKQKLQSIFDSFSQADSSNTKAYGGVGLGLTISKKLIEMMGGEVWVESAEGKSSAFHFTVKLWQQIKNNEISLTGSNLNGIKLLIVDENLAYQSIIKDELDQQGATVVLAQNSADGMQALINSEADQQFDLVVADHVLSDMDNVGFIDKIRNQYHKRKDIPVLLLGAYCKYSNFTREDKFSAVSCIKKPVRTASLIVAIKQAVS